MVEPLSSCPKFLKTYGTQCIRIRNPNRTLTHTSSNTGAGNLVKQYLAAITFSNRYSENSNFNLQLCVALCNGFESLMLEIKKIYFLFIIFFSNSNLNLKICVGLRIAIKKSYAKMKKIYPWNSNLCKLSLQKLPETCGTHGSHQFWKG